MLICPPFHIPPQQKSGLWWITPPKKTNMTMKKQPVQDVFLVGGFNPFEKY